MGRTYRVSDTPHPTTSAFVADQVEGRWLDARPVSVPGADVSALRVLSCTTADDCSGAGVFHDATDPDVDNQSIFTVERIGGTWGTPVPMTGLSALNTANDARVVDLSCSMPGECAATGYFTEATGKVPVVANSSNGVWDAPIPVPGLLEPSLGDCTFSILGARCASGLSVVCSSRFVCTAVGDTYPNDIGRGFLVDYSSIPEPVPVPPEPVRPVFTG